MLCAENFFCGREVVGEAKELVCALLKVELSREERFVENCDP